MSTAGPDPNGSTPPSPAARRGEIGDTAAARLGMPSVLTAVVVVALAVGFLLYVLL
jgi:hypothetical protein